MITRQQTVDISDKRCDNLSYAERRCTHHAGILGHYAAAEGRYAHATGQSGRASAAPHHADLRPAGHITFRANAFAPRSSDTPRRTGRTTDSSVRRSADAITDPRTAGPIVGPRRIAPSPTRHLESQPDKLLRLSAGGHADDVGFWRGQPRRRDCFRG